MSIIWISDQNLTFKNETLFFNCGTRGGDRNLAYISLQRDTCATTSEMEADPTSRLCLCFRRMPAWIHAFGAKSNQYKGKQVCTIWLWLFLQYANCVQYVSCLHAWNTTEKLYYNCQQLQYTEYSDQNYTTMKCTQCDPPIAFCNNKSNISCNF